MEKMNSVILGILISAGAISLSMAAVDKIPAIWSFVLPWLRPPYLHVVINVIIIAIAAASRSRRGQTAPPARPRHLISVETPPPAYYAAYSSPPEVREVVEDPAAAAVYERADRVVELKPVMVNGFAVDEDAEEEVESDGAVDGRSTLTYNTPSPERFSPEFQLEYFPPAIHPGNILERESTRKKSGEEVRHGGGRRPVRKSKSFKERSVDFDPPASRAEASLSRNRRVEAPMGRSLTRNSLRPQNPIGKIPSRFKETAEEYETMESAWKKITEGASRSRASVEEEACCVGLPLRKSSSFDEREIYNEPASSSGIRKEESPSQDELNRRIEAFIQKVNDEIRLRRQNSSNQYIQLNSAA